MEKSNKDRVNTGAIYYTGQELSYSGQGCHRVPEALGKLYGGKTTCLDLSYNEICSLRGLEPFADRLRQLILDNNQLSDNFELPFMPHLDTLSLNKNHIADIESTMEKISTNCPNLSYLSLLGNSACPNQLANVDNDERDYQRYRYYVLHRLPNLIFLDSNRVSEEERKEARTRGQFMRVVKPKEQPSQDQSNDILRSELAHKGYNPLPSSIRKYNEHKGAYGKCRYKYSGKHSEGNRFISNKDL